jgi:hypothetical protein
MPTAGFRLAEFRLLAVPDWIFADSAAITLHPYGGISHSGTMPGLIEFGNLHPGLDSVPALNEIQRGGGIHRTETTIWGKIP